VADPDIVERADPSVFDYEVVRPVEYEVVSTQQFRGVEMQRIKFDSAVGGTAYGYLSLPVSDPVDAGILWGHGAPSDGTDNFVPMSIFACAGATSVVVDAPYARPGELRSNKEFLFTRQDRDEQIQLIVDMRRALDLLTDLGATRFGFGGISYGSAMGGLLVGVDDRISTAVLLLGNGGLVERFTDEEGAPTWPLTDKSDEEIEAWFEAMLPIEPIRFVGDSTADLLFMSGDKDPLIPPAEAERYHAAAPAGAELVWMDEAHDIPFEEFPVHNNWLGDRLGVNRARLEACTDELFPNGWDDL
jgi:predicted esterase